MKTAKKHKILINNLYFCAAHFLSWVETKQCCASTKFENLHGHNYNVSLTISGELNDDGVVADFISIKKLIDNILEKINHKFIVPEKNSALKICNTQDFIEVTAGQSFLRLPCYSLFILPYENSSVEFIAEYLCSQLIFEIKNQKKHETDKISVVEVSVTEEPGCSASCEMSM